MKEPIKKTASHKTERSWSKQLADRVAIGYNRLPRFVRALIWVVFFTGFAAYSALSIRDGLQGKSNSGLSISALEPAPEIGIGSPPARPLLSSAEYGQVLKATRSLDSLRRICLPCYEELTAHHPGFADSLKQIIRIYNNQPKPDFRP